MSLLRALLRDRRAASAAEFALVLPLLILLLFSVIDGGRYLWEYNRAEKATQMGVRYAAATDAVASGFADYSFAVEDDVPAGDPVPVANFDNMVCTNASCTCVGGGVCGEVALDATAFNALVARINDFKPDVTANDVQVTYRNVGLGYSGDPNGPDVAPLVTVELRNLNFQPLTTLIFGVTVGMPSFKASLTAEDLSGNFSN